MDAIWMLISSHSPPSHSYLEHVEISIDIGLSYGHSSDFTLPEAGHPPNSDIYFVSGKFGVSCKDFFVT